MGDMSELRTIVVVIAFITCTISLITLMTAQSPVLFSEVSDTGVSPMGDSELSNPSSLIAWNETLNIALNKTWESLIQTFNIGGWNMRSYVDIPYGSSDEYIQIQTFDIVSVWGYTLWEHGHQDFTWYNSSKQRVSRSDVPMPSPFGPGYPEVMPIWQLDYDYVYGNSSSSLNNLAYTIRNTHCSLNMVFNFNTTLYDSPSSCYDNGGDLIMTFTIQWDERNTSMNALDFIGKLFTFSLPGINPVVTLIILSPIYAGLAYLAFIFVLRIIGAVFGGGGA